ncbi:MULTISPECIES: DNA-directed RNA polymerase subunit delta [unclassified Mycoplasma]|uniref:DNA-directed RNA polymerase subunit delta n=1 Tax=unclassified Mycoplasma TaxID=2683645 RepID=UPI00216B5B4A|nr:MULTISPECIES: hypothetical protein [unclassified Mycoplasma]MCS4536703.1 hypothetical protein [Mycoplasma sp. CSL7475-4]MCT4469810.1 hypothetical protein [Mycoplasma sp. HS2188]
MKTMLDVVSEIAFNECKNGNFVEYNFLFDKVEAELKTKWEILASESGKDYSVIRVNKLGELYRLLTVDSNFIRNSKGQWSIRPGFTI